MTATWAAISMSSRLRLFTIPATIAGTGPQVRLHLGTKAPGPARSATPSDDYEPWRSAGRALPTGPPNPARPGHLEPVPTRDDTRATVTPEATVSPEATVTPEATVSPEATIKPGRQSRPDGEPGLAPRSSSLTGEAIHRVPKAGQDLEGRRTCYHGP
jgi:hypothetical protein